MNYKRVSLLIKYEDDEGKKDWRVYCGEIYFDQDNNPMFSSSEDYAWPLPLDFLERIKPVPAHLRSILLDADDYIPLTIGNLPQGETRNGLIKTGLKWK